MAEIKASDATRIVDAILDDADERGMLVDSYEDPLDDDDRDEIRAEWIRIVLED